MLALSLGVSLNVPLSPRHPCRGSCNALAAVRPPPTPPAARHPAARGGPGGRTALGRLRRLPGRCGHTTTPPAKHHPPSAHRAPRAPQDTNDVVTLGGSAVRKTHVLLGVRPESLGADHPHDETVRMQQNKRFPTASRPPASPLLASARFPPLPSRLPARRWPGACRAFPPVGAGLGPQFPQPRANSMSPNSTTQGPGG